MWTSFVWTAIACMCLLHMEMIHRADAELDLQTMQEQLQTLTRQIMLQHLYVEESSRSEGHSGIKQQRVNKHGTRPYHAPSHTLRSAAAIHDHANNIRTVGMGEFVAVLNGLEFRTRHNDYRLKKPHSTSKQYDAVEDIQFPPVPPPVTQKGANISAQIEEMKEWFNAWKDQDSSVRDYRKYFKPVLCYLEGAWTTTTDSIDEPFDSDRHFIDAKSWLDLQEKIRFTSYTGSKSRLENLAYLPTTIIDIINGTIPVLAQWNYRIMCQPLKRDIPLDRFRVVDDLNSRLTYGRTYEELGATRAARFQLNPEDASKWIETRSMYGMLDEIMSEIPGKDNENAQIIDDAYDEVAYELEPEDGVDKVLNAAYYHRAYKSSKKGAMGLQSNYRGFSDQNLYMAMTTQPKIAGMSFDKCTGWGKKKVCIKQEQKWTYAIPLEIIYLTPLSEWNPYKLEYKGEGSSELGKTVIADGRNGGKLAPYNGTNSKLFFRTPVEFYSGGIVGSDAADTTRGAVNVLDPNNDVKRVRASGHHVFLPNIPGVGIVRQRYPIMPVYGEGSGVWKELEALKDIVLNLPTHWELLREKPQLAGDVSSTGSGSAVGLVLRTSPGGGGHVHEIELNQWEAAYITSGNFLVTITEEGDVNEEMMHQHNVKVIMNDGQFLLLKCDKMKRYEGCADGHSEFLTIV